MKGQARLAKAAVDSLVRTSQDTMLVVVSLADAETEKGLRRLVKPNSPSKALRKAGLALLLSPDPLGPIVDVPAVALLGVSYAMKDRDPESIGSMFRETQSVLDGLEPLAL
ncbi:MAG: hypothetical protein ABSF83_04185 [Nitrososphaerales archaeon]